MISLGHENYINHEEIVVVIKPGSAPAKKLRDEAKVRQRLVDATTGKKTRSIIVTKTNHIILCTTQTKTIRDRVWEQRKRDQRKR
jgi:extracellular matrix regulatory protein A